MYRREGRSMPTDQHTETWANWMPSGWIGPADEELITRGELLTRAKGFGADIHPRTLQILENQGLVPRPIRRWHDGAVRALYAPWVVDLALRAYERRRGKWPLERAIEDVRGAVKGAIFTHLMDTDQLVSDRLLAQLRELADQHAQRTGTPIQSSEIRLLDAEGRAVATLRLKFSDSR